MRSLTFPVTDHPQLDMDRRLLFAGLGEVEVQHRVQMALMADDHPLVQPIGQRHGDPPVAGSMKRMTPDGDQ
ncbi:MAG: hypothetical protein ACE5EQ_05415 [Phycisphaerae bacterium]